jgi:hypothetical protein
MSQQLMQEKQKLQTEKEVYIKEQKKQNLSVPMHSRILNREMNMGANANNREEKKEEDEMSMQIDTSSIYQ